MAVAGRILMIPKGDYDANTDYEMLDIVNHNGNTWIARKSSKGIEPSEANKDYWQKLLVSNS